MKTRKRIYVAGPYSADNVIQILENIRIGQRVSVEVLLAGFAPFCPWLDYQFQLMLRPGEKLTVHDYYEYSMAWVDVSHAMLVLPGWEHSTGTLAEIERAKEVNIPIYYSMEEMVENERD